MTQANFCTEINGKTIEIRNQYLPADVPAAEIPDPQILRVLWEVFSKQKT